MTARRLAALALSAALAATAAAQKPPAPAAVTPASKPDASWQKRHQTLVERTKDGGIDVLFVGDSITQGWEGAGKKVWDERFGPWKPGNIGIGGDRTQHVLWRITEGKEIAGVDPKAVVLMIGTNNVGSDSADDIAAGIASIVKEFRTQKPKAKVLLLAVFPRSLKPGRSITEASVPADQLHPKIKEINGKIQKLADGQHVVYLDIGPKFLDDKGALPKAIMPDFLHLSPDGYKLWADAIEKPVNELLK